MKLLYITSLSGLRINGFMRSAIVAARDIGIEFTMACNMDHADKRLYAEDCEYYGIKAVHIDFDRNPVLPKNYTIARKQLTELMKKEHYDVVHCNTPIGGVLGRICAKKAKVPYVIYQAHGFHFWKGAPVMNWVLYYPVEWLLARHTDMLITINNEDYEQARNFHLKKRGKVVMVPGVGVDLSKFNADFRLSKEGKEIRRSIRKKWMIDAAARVFVSVGELNDNKNQEVAIRALAKMKNPSYYYVLCGEGEKKEYLIQLAEELRIADRVMFLGYQNNISDILIACDYFVFTSLREGLPGALMEAMASGIPCIASKIRGCTDLLRGSKYMFDPRNPDDLAEKMTGIIEYKESQKEVARNREYVVNFDINNAINSLKALYKSIGDKLNEKNNTPSVKH